MPHEEKLTANINETTVATLDLSSLLMQPMFIQGTTVTFQLQLINNPQTELGPITVSIEPGRFDVPPKIFVELPDDFPIGTGIQITLPDTYRGHEIIIIKDDVRISSDTRVDITYTDASLDQASIDLQHSLVFDHNGDIQFPQGIPFDFGGFGLTDYTEFDFAITVENQTSEGRVNIWFRYDQETAEWNMEFGTSGNDGLVDTLDPNTTLKIYIPPEMSIDKINLPEGYDHGNIILIPHDTTYGTDTPGITFLAYDSKYDAEYESTFSAEQGSYVYTDPQDAGLFSTVFTAFGLKFIYDMFFTHDKIEKQLQNAQDIFIRKVGNIPTKRLEKLTAKYGDDNDGLTKKIFNIAATNYKLDFFSTLARPASVVIILTAFLTFIFPPAAIAVGIIGMIGLAVYGTAKYCGLKRFKNKNGTITARIDNLRKHLAETTYAGSNFRNKFTAAIQQRTANFQTTQNTTATTIQQGILARWRQKIEKFTLNDALTTTLAGSILLRLATIGKGFSAALASLAFIGVAITGFINASILFYKNERDNKKYHRNLGELIRAAKTRNLSAASGLWKRKSIFSRYIRANRASILQELLERNIITLAMQQEFKTRDIVRILSITDITQIPGTSKDLATLNLLSELRAKYIAECQEVDLYQLFKTYAAQQSLPLTNIEQQTAVIDNFVTHIAVNHSFNATMRTGVIGSLVAVIILVGVLALVANPLSLAAIVIPTVAVALTGLAITAIKSKSDNNQQNRYITPTRATGVASTLMLAGATVAVLLLAGNPFSLAALAVVGVTAVIIGVGATFAIAKYRKYKLKQRLKKELNSPATSARTEANDIKTTINKLAEINSDNLDAIQPSAKVEASFKDDKRKFAREAAAVVTAKTSRKVQLAATNTGMVFRDIVGDDSKFFCAAGGSRKYPEYKYGNEPTTTELASRGI